MFIAFFVGFAIALVVNLISKEKLSAHLKVALLLFGVALLGVTAGFTGGMSRDGAVGTIIPAALTLIGGLAVYLFGADTTKGSAVSLTAGSFALALFLGYSSSSQIRHDWESASAFRTKCFDTYAKAAALNPDTQLDALLRSRCLTAWGGNPDAIGGET